MIKKLLKKTVKCMMILSVVLSGLMVSGLSDAYAIAVTNKNQIPVGDTVVYNGKISYSGSTVGNFSIRGMQAFCMQHPKKTPAGGTKLTNAIYENANIRKVLYYGWGGPAQWSGFNGNKAYGIVATSKVLSHYYNGDDYDSVGKNFYNFLQGKTVPDPSVNFNKSEVTAYIENGIQRTETLTLASQSNMFGVKINLDSDMTYVNESNNTRQTGGTVEIKGQTRFHFEAPLSHKGKTWASGNMTAGYQFQPIVGTPASSNLQKIGHLEGVADPMKTTSLKVNWITLQPVATVKKVTKAEANGTVVSGNDLSGVEIQVIAKNEVRNSETDEVVFEAGEVVGTYNPDSEGNLVIDDLPQFKEDESVTYIIKETKTVDGLILDDTEYELTFDIDNNSQELEIVNGMITCSFSKTGVTGEEEIEGAHLQVVDSEGTVVDEWVSGSEEHVINGLTIGETYKMVETIAPEGYAKASDVTFKVLNTTEVQHVKMVDTMVQVSKVDENGNYVKGATLQLTDETHKVIDEWVSGQHLVDISEEELAELTAGNAVRGTLESGEKYTISKNSEDYTLSIVKNNERHIYRVDGKGDETIHVLNGLVAGGEYTLREIKTPKGYSTADDIELVVNEEENMDIQMVDEITKIVLHKQDITSKKELEGAHLKVVDSEGNVVDEWISTNVPHEIRGLTVGETYTMIETIAPKGYSIAESVEFTVTDTGVEQQVVMYDALLPKKVSTGDSTAIANYILMAIASIVVFFAFKERNA